MREVVEPGTRFVERYRLEQRLGGGPATTWLAHDELLDRPVALCLLGSADPGSERLLTAARRAAALTDARFLRVLDAAEQDDLVYVVSEWVASRTVADLVTETTMSPHEARDLGLELTAALTAAHELGLYHLALRPDQVRRTAHGQTKLAGLGVTAATEGVSAATEEEAARRDTEGVGAVLYAALTGRWPGAETTELPPAPRDGELPCTPRQVRAGVPDALDEVVSRALGRHGRHGGPILRVEDLHDALAGLALNGRHTVPLAALDDRDAAEPAVQTTGASRAPRAAWVVAGLVLLIGLVLAASQLALGGLDRQESTTEVPPGQDRQDGVNSVGPVQVDSVRALDSPPPDGNGEEHDEQAPLAIDGDPNTAWSTMTYFDPLPLLKGGVGLMLDLGEAQPVSEVVLQLEGGPTAVQVRVGDIPSSDPGQFRTVATEKDASGETTITFEQVTARYVLLWLTDLPQVDDQEYRGEVSEVAVRG